MEKTIKKIGLSRIVLIITALLITMFSGFMLLRISRLNHLIYNECEPRKYEPWTKEIKIFLIPERILELESEIANAKFQINENPPHEAYNTGLDLSQFSEEMNKRTIERNEKLLEQGYEIDQIPDEESRGTSRKEAQGYKNCLKNQELATKQRPETYKFLFIGDTLIAIVGLLVVFATKEK
jgi:hypothetical protein